MQASLLALGLYRSSGGPSKSVAAFQRALSAKVVSWVDPIQYGHEPLVWEHSTVVRGRRLPILRQLLVPRSDDARAAEAVMRASDFVSCHSFWRWHNMWLAHVAAKYSIPYWFVPHGGLDPYVFRSGQAGKRLFMAAARPFLENAAAVVCATRREYEKVFRYCPRAKPIILPWPLDNADFRRRDTGAGLRLRHTLGIPEHAFCLLYFGRLDPMKQPLETIDAVAEAGVPDIHLIMMGNEYGVTVDQCKERARQRGLGSRTHVIGGRYGAEKEAVIDAADAYISLSHRENFNFTAAESLAAGLPVILSPGNDLAGELAGVDCGVMLRSLEEAPSALSYMHQSGSGHRHQMGCNGRLWAETHLRAELFEQRIREHAATLAKTAQ